MHRRITRITGKKIIITPLDWGLGHATRCIPIIKELAKNNTCIIATSGRALELLRQEFPNLSIEEIPAYNIAYGKNKFWTMLKLLFQIPKSVIVKNKEVLIADELVQKHNADLIISDNRFGMHSKLCKNVFITHQIRVRLPLCLRLFEYSFFMINRIMISKFDECWIPDYEGTKNLSGILSHSWSVPNMHYIGPLSGRELTNCPMEYDVVAIISGPEPQRTIFEKELRAILPQLPYKSCIVRGVVASKNNFTHIGNCRIQTFATNEEINKFLCGSKIIISRAGYSSIMDYENLKLKAILVPTPGQSEQLYLGQYLQHKEHYWCVPQQKLSKKLPMIIREAIMHQKKHK
ncbi:MAG: glycosyltransferase [Bacteroidales bacterium]|jgi:uncharacterized protein (TIGR00661 family)|nr:glycosyltransferase [Bacteroidales bacterium]